MISPRAQFRRGFTLIELLVVIGIIALLAAITVPALNAIKRGDAISAATQQLLDDLAYARQLAISRHTTNYMVFVPPNFWTLPNYIARQEGTNLFDKQFIGYTFVTLRSVGDQPGQKSPDYIGPWRTMPENTFILTNKFRLRNDTDPNNTKIYDPPSSTAPQDIKYIIKGFEQTTAIPFPSEEVYNPANPNQLFASLPYIAFDYLGRLTSGEDEYIPVARGSAAFGRNPQTKTPLAVLPDLREEPPGNGTNAYNVIHIDWLTGRARLEKLEIR